MNGRQSDAQFRRSLLRPAAVLLSVLWALGVALPAAALSEAQLRQTLASYLAHPALRGAQTACVVRRLDQPESLFSSHGTRPLTPASVTKLLVSGTAVNLLGADFVYGAAAWSDAPVSTDGVLRADLYLEGTADPQADGALARALARSLQEQGLRGISGDLVGVGAQLAGDRDRGLSGARRLHQALGELGITVEGQPREASFQSAPVLLARRSTVALPAFLAQVNKQSSNARADRLLQSLLVSFAEAEQPEAGWVLRHWSLLGVENSGAVLVDGSGYSPRNRLSAGLVVETLQRVVRCPGGYQTLSRSLPVAGVDGTLAGRMRGTAAQGRVRAKTGTLPRVSALAGYVEHEGQGRLAFCILMDQLSCSTTTARRIQDQMAIAMARFVREQTD